MLFEKFVKQHRIYRFVAYAKEIAIFVAHDKVGVNLSYVFGDQTKLRRIFGVAFVMEDHRLECPDGFAGIIHWSNIVLKTLRLGLSPQIPGGIHSHKHHGGGINWLPVDVANVAATADVIARHVLADTNNVISGGDTSASEVAQSDIVAASRVSARERSCTYRYVEVATAVAQRIITDPHVVTAIDVARTRIETYGGVFDPDGIAGERGWANANIAVAVSVVQERLIANSSVEEAVGVAK